MTCRYSHRTAVGNEWLLAPAAKTKRLAAAGSLLALWITHTPLNVGSYTGIIMIIGIIGENAVFTYQQYREALKTQAPEAPAAPV